MDAKTPIEHAGVGAETTTPAPHAEGPPGRSGGARRGAGAARRPAAPARPADRVSAPDPGPLRPPLRRASRGAGRRDALAQAEVYEVATFYAHFDVVKEGETPPPPVTVRVCDSLSCAMSGAEKLLAELQAKLGPGRARGARALHGRLRQGAGRRGRPRAGDAAPTSGRRRRRARKSAHAHPHEPQVDFAAYRAAGGYELLTPASRAGARATT